jgi:hypothetical protein
MKRKAMYLLIGLVVTFVGVQAYTTMSTKGTPQQPYTVLKTIGDLEVRRYPEALTASVLRSGTTYKEVSSSGFRSLAGYIFGGNAEEKKIAMTAPVHMEVGADSSRMRFVMPEGLTMDSLPAPNDPNVKLERVPEEVVAVLRFGGFSNDERISEHSAELLRQVRSAGLEVMGPVRFMGYDPPWQLVARRNEVVVAVRWDM